MIVNGKTGTCVSHLEKEEFYRIFSFSSERGVRMHARQFLRQQKYCL